MIAIAAAMDEEIKEFRNKISGMKTNHWAGFDFYSGKIGVSDIVLVRTGVGKTMSAMLTQKLIDLYNPEFLIFTGIAGALNNQLQIGDVLVAADAVQHDMDATAVGFKRGEIPYSGYRFIKCDQKLLNLVENYSPSGYKIQKGRILTGDQFLSAAYRENYKYLTEELKGDAVEMEGASAGLVAAVNNVPFLLLRVISDKADGKAPEDFKSFLSGASRKSFEIVSYILKELA